jgi:oligopeptidase B
VSAFDNLPDAPKAAKHPITDEHHGITRSDDYAWFRADNWQEVFHDTTLLPADIRSHLEAENAFMEAALSDTKALQDKIFKEIRGRIKEDESSIPEKDGPYAYGVLYETGGEHAHYFRTPRDGGEKTILMNGDEMAKGKAYFSMSGIDASADHRFGIWGLDDKGSEYYTLRIRDLNTLTDLDDVIEKTNADSAWAKDGKSFFYTIMDENHRPCRVYHHIIGEPQSADRLVYEEKDPSFFVSVSTSTLFDFVEIHVNDHQTSEARLIYSADLLAEPRIVAPRKDNVEYSIAPGGDILYILTNENGAKDFAIVTAPLSNPAKENWTEVVAHEPGRLILSHDVYQRHLVWMERRNSLPRIVIRDRVSGEEHVIAFDEEAYSLGLHGAAEYDTDLIRFSYSSMTTPSQEFEYNMATRERVLLKTQQVPSGHNPEDYITRRITVKSHDGAEVPVTLLYHKNTALDGTAPCLLYGYGAYGITIPASFSVSNLSLVDRGFVYAVAHVRGGKDKGFAWYEDGKMAAKQNTFKDFIAAADHLVAEGFTAYDRIVAEGGSAGGMLMGAIANMAPEKFKGIIAAVPFVDVMATMLDDTLPLTPPEWQEWGNPLHSKEQYQWIAAYSPYDNVKAQAYPAILALSGLTDPRVTYWEPTKWVAKLRDYNTGSAPILLKTNMDAGHGGKSGRFESLHETALEYAFALKVVGKIEA